MLKMISNYNEKGLYQVVLSVLGRLLKEIRQMLLGLSVMALGKLYIFLFLHFSVPTVIL